MYRFFKWLLALFLILFGSVLLLRNLDIISTEIIDDFWAAWPLILVVLGLMMTIQYFHPEKHGSWKIGSFLIIFGGLLLAGNYDYIDFEFSDIWHLWPLIIIYIGASLLFGNGSADIEIITPKKNKSYKSFVYTTNDSDHEEEKESKDAEKDDEYAGESTGHKRTNYKFHYDKNIKHFVADRDFSSDNWEVQSMSIKTGVGDLYFDFSKAYIPDQESTIELKGYVADISMKIPDNIPVKIFSKVSIGEVQVGQENRSGFNNTIRYQTDDYDEATRKLNIIMNYQIGDINVVFV